MFFFAFWGAENHVFNILPNCSRSYVLRVSGVWRSLIVCLSEINAKTSFACVRYLKNTIGYTGNHKQICVDHLNFLVIFIEIYVTVWLLCAHPLMTSINFILEDPTLKKTSVTYLFFMFRLVFFFRMLISWKATYSHLSISLLELCTNEFRVLGGQYRTEIKAKTSFSWGRFFKYANWKYRYSYTNLFIWTLAQSLVSQKHVIRIAPFRFTSY